MQTDRTTKLLLASITVALWGLLLKPLMAPLRANADAPQEVNIVAVDGVRLDRVLGPLGAKPVLPVGVQSHPLNPVWTKPVP